MEIYKGKYFEVVFCDWCQDFLGQCIISGKKQSLFDMEPEEWLELAKLENELERICKKLFNATMFNFCCLMNQAYKNNIQPHVHYWLYPRYREKVNIFGKEFEDIHFGYNFWKWNDNKELCQKDIFTKEEKEKIFNMIKNEWSIYN